MTHMNDKILRCKKCGNTDTFHVSAVEHHTWVVDNQGTFMTDQECGDAESSDDYTCTQCGSGEVDWVHVEEFTDSPCPHCGLPKDDPSLQPVAELIWDECSDYAAENGLEQP